jgi:hypothetical protein
LAEACLDEVLSARVQRLTLKDPDRARANDIVYLRDDLWKFLKEIRTQTGNVSVFGGA